MSHVNNFFFQPVFICLLLLVTNPSLWAADDELPAEQVAYFEKHIRPLLIAKCYSCHSEKSGESKGGLLLDRRDGWIKGGDSGTAIIPNKPDQSLLISAVLYDNSDLQMPPDGKLSSQEIRVLETWVRLGAVDPRSEEVSKKIVSMIDIETGRKHWAFQPLPTQRPVQGFINQAIAAGLKKHKLKPAPPADKGILLRRVSLDLTGLPPTREELDQFLSDTSDRAFEKVVDRLLNSPRFGEQFGRHWLDLMCYADTLDLVGIPARNAWRYRDYVIESINNDRPFHQFIRQQIAGDLLPAKNDSERRENLIATGFLAIGPYSLMDVDKPQLRMDTVDHQIDKIGRAFLGLSLGCARCHDHKFDPVAQSDYYAMAGIFTSTETVGGVIASTFTDVVRNPIPETAAEKAAREQELATYQTRVNAAQKAHKKADAKVAALKELVLISEADPASKAATSPTVAASTDEKAALKKSLAYAEKLAKKKHDAYYHTLWLKPELPKALGVKESKTPNDCRINVRGSAWTLGSKVPRGFIRVTTLGSPPEIPKTTSGRLQLADWLVGPASHLTARVTVNRLWSYIIGQGLVKSVDDFGKFGGQPSHPELLDQLATELIASNWSVKHIVRLIVTSQPYRIGSSPAAMGMAIDPENRFCWRANVRRLRAEEIRDSMIHISGQLVERRGGPAMPLEILENLSGFNDNVNPELFRYRKPAKDQAVQRTVYLPVYRGQQQGLMQMADVFNFPFPNDIAANRQTSIVAPQALFLMNSKFVQGQSKALADRLANETKSESERVNQLFRLVYMRPATAVEQKVCLKFVKTGGWEQLCQTVLASNEFLFIR